MNLLILGAGEFGQMIEEMISPQFNKIVFLDDCSKKAVGKLCDYSQYTDFRYALVAIGNAEVRRKWNQLLEAAGFELITLISPHAIVSPHAKVEKGCIIEEMAVVKHGATVKQGSIISSGAIINHNSTVGEYCHIDCNAVVGADAVVPDRMHLDYAQVLKKNFEL